MEPENTPYYTENQKQIYKQIKESKQPPGYPPVSTEYTPGVKQQTPNIPTYTPPIPKDDKMLIDLQVYQQPKPKPDPLLGKQAALPIQPIALTSPFIPPQFSSYLNNFMKNFYTPFIYKDYHINIGGPNADHVTASMIYEDAIPQGDIYMSYKTLRDRNNLVDYVRSNFIRVTEGEYIDFQGTDTSLNSRLNLIQLNPFDTNIHGGGPYKGLAKGFLIYKSCWPIMYDKRGATSVCQKNSIGLIVRVYQLSQDALIAKYPEVLSKMIKNDISTVTVVPKHNNPEEYDVWRDVKYYEYIRESIDKKFISPNFIQSYCFFLNTDTKFDFTKINGSIQPKPFDPSVCKTAVVLLNESPNQNIAQWSSNIYTPNGKIKTQVQSGFKPKDKWETILFQMLSAFHIMDKYKFTINYMSINNFFIKDVNIYGDSGNQFWVYKINRIDYYVPCKGELLLVDHDFTDIKLNMGKIPPPLYKIIGKIFGDNESDIEERIRANSINCINISNFINSNGQIAPPTDIIKLIGKINSDLTEKDDKNKYKYSIEQIIQNNFIKFINNRVGTILRDDEKAYIRKGDVRPFNKGELVIYETKYDTYEIVMYLENFDEYKCKCASTDKGEMVIKDCQKDLIYHYSENEIIKQDTLPGRPNISLDYIIETYTM